MRRSWHCDEAADPPSSAPPPLGAPLLPLLAMGVAAAITCAKRFAESAAERLLWKERGEGRAAAACFSSRNLSRVFRIEPACWYRRSDAAFPAPECMLLVLIALACLWGVLWGVLWAGVGDSQTDTLGSPPPLPATALRSQQSRRVASAAGARVSRGRRLACEVPPQAYFQAWRGGLPVKCSSALLAILAA